MANPLPRRRRTATPVANARPAANIVSFNFKQRLKLEYVDLTDITPYPFNPRDNEKAIPSVAESIRQYGFVVPCVIDDNNVLVAGHTRTEAAKLLGMTEVPCIRASHLNEEQIAAFRLIDNKVASLAGWDFDLLGAEMARLHDVVDFTAFGWTQDEIDCLSEVVAADCLDATASAQAATEESGSVHARRSPQTARFVLGEVVFFVPVQEYRTWVDGVRQLHDFNEVRIVSDIKRRLGMLE